MKEVKYKNFPAIGSRTASWEYSLLDEFLLKTPLLAYELVIFGVIPPLHILNEILALNSYDAGMGGACEWKPFKINQEEYIELVENLITNPKFNIIVDDELNNQIDFKNWHAAMLSKYKRNI